MTALLSSKDNVLKKGYMRTIFMLVLLHQLPAYADNGEVYDNVRSLNSPEGCSETTLCADGYTTLGKDRFGNDRDHVYPPQRVTLSQWVKANKVYSAEGRDQFGLNPTGKAEDGQSIKAGNVFY